MIPKTIYSMWFGEQAPPLVQMCSKSKQLTGYSLNNITLDNHFKDSKYVQECLASPHLAEKWCKLTDYLRVWYLYNHGGIYLDSDVEVKDGDKFDNLLSHRAFAGRERNGWIGSAVIGSEPGHPFFKRWLDTMEAHFRGDDNKCFEASMELLTKGYYELGWDTDKFVIYPNDYFYPYNHEDGTINYTDKTICFHYFMKTWKK